MTSIRSLLALMAAVGTAGVALGSEAGVDAELRAARLRASAALMAAHSAIEQAQPDRALGAYRQAWRALADLPGSEAFNDLVVLDAATELARESLAQHDNASARIATQAALWRIHTS